MDPQLSEVGRLRDELTQLVAQNAALRARVAELEAVKQRVKLLAWHPGQLRHQPLADSIRYILGEA